ncbi:hypothetical protein BGZ89_005501, partial [Linnemannia elongata]
MSLYRIKRILAYATEHKCIVEMLYLVDEKSFRELEDLDEYTGEVTSCMNLLEGIQ